MKLRNLIFLLLLPLLSQSQTIDLIKDLRAGSGSGFLNSSCSLKGDLFFIGQDDGPSYREVFSLDSEGTIKKIAMSPDVRGAETTLNTDNFIYIYNREAPFVRDLYRYSTNSLDKLHSFDNPIEQSFSFKNGVVFIEEDNAKNKKLLYIPDNANEAFTILENVNLGQYDFDITASNKFLIISPLNDKDYDGGVTVYNTDTRQVENTILSDHCDEPRYAYGFEDHIVYSCNGQYFILNINTSEKLTLGIDGKFSLRYLVENNYLTETENYIFIRPQEEDVLLSISKESLLVEELSSKVGTLVSSKDHGDLIYFVEIDNAGKFHLFESNGSINSRKEIIYNDKFTLKALAFLNEKPHFIISQGSSFQDDLLVTIDDNYNLLAIKQLFYSNYKAILERIGDKLVFADNENGLGIELYELYYTGTAVDDYAFSKLLLYPNPSNGRIKIPELSKNQPAEIKVLSSLGELIPFERNMDELVINQIGIFQVFIYSGNRVYSNKIVVLD